MLKILFYLKLFWQRGYFGPVVNLHIGFLFFHMIKPGLVEPVHTGKVLLNVYGQCFILIGLASLMIIKYFEYHP